MSIQVIQTPTLPPQLGDLHVEDHGATPSSNNPSPKAPLMKRKSKMRDLDVRTYTSWHFGLGFWICSFIPTRLPVLVNAATATGEHAVSCYV